MGEVKDYFSNTDKTLAAMEVMNNETQFKLLELKDYVDHFGDNLVLASTQITVESKVGFSTRPMNLQDVLKMVNKIITNTSTTVSEHTTQLDQNTAAISTKADATLGLTVNECQNKLEAIEAHLKQEEDQGISALRKNCEELTHNVESILTDLAEKCDRKSVDVIVHNKYEDIVEYLQQALQSSAEDEEGFKQKAAEVQESMEKLALSKADRIEIMTMQEALVKIEATFQKMTALMKTKEEQGELISKVEAEEKIAEKVDRNEFKEELHNIIRMIKRNRKNSVMAGGFGDVEDEGVPGILSASMPNLRSIQNEGDLGGHGGGGGGGGGGGVGGEGRGGEGGDGESLVLPPIRPEDYIGGGDSWEARPGSNRVQVK